MFRTNARKSLAVLAAATLGASLLVGAPASANVRLALGPAYAGQELAVPTGNAFVLKVNYLAGNSNANSNTLKFLLQSNGAIGIKALANASAATAAGVDQGNNTTNEVIAANSTSGVVAAATSAGVGHLGIGLRAGSTSTTYTVTATAWEDNDGSGAINGDEWRSAPVTITFLKHSDINWGISLDPVNVGTSNQDFDVAVSSTNINLSQLVETSTTSQLALRFAIGTAVAGSAPTLAFYDKDDNVAYAEGPTGNTLAAGNVVNTSLYFGSAQIVGVVAATSTGWLKTILGTDNQAWSTAPSGGATAVKTNAVTVVANTLATIGRVVTTASSTVSAATDSDTATANVLSGATTVTVSSTVTVAAGQSKSGQVVTFTVEENGNSTLSAGASVATGGKTFSNTNVGTVQRVSVTAVTDADGKATISITTAGLKDADAFKVIASGQGLATKSLTVTAKDRTAATVRAINAIGNSAQLTFPAAQTVTITAAVVDQFGVGISDAGYAVKATDDSGTPRTITASVSNGTATLVMPAYATAQTRTVTLQAVKNGVDVSGVTSTVAVTIGTETAVANLTYSGSVTGTGANFGVGSDVDLGLNTKAFTAVDTRVAGSAPTLDAQYVTVTATTLNASNAAVAGSVTFSGTNLDFESDGVYARGSITVRSNASGVASVKVYSNISGSKVLTIASGSVTRTQTIVHAAPAASAATAINITTPANVPAGRTLTVTGIVVDKFGNGVDATNFALSYAGPGFYSTLPSSLVDGKFAFNVLIGSNETGTATISASVYTGSDRISASKSVNIGSGAASGAGKVNVGSFNGKLVVYASGLSGKTISWKVGGTWGKQVAASNYAVFNRPTPRAGVTVSVNIYVDGVLTLTKSVVTR
jgi:hypothetical protein